VKINGTFARGVSWNYEWTQCLENPMEVIPRGSGKRSIKRRRLDFMSGNVEVDDATKQTDGTYLITFLVAEELSVEAILGMRALTNMGALIDTVHGILVFGDQAYDYRNKSPKFRAASEVTIMPNRGARVKVNAINIEDGNYLVDDCIPLLNVGMEVESAWVSVEDGVAYLSINNSSPMPIRINTGSEIVSLVESVDNNEDMESINKDEVTMGPQLSQSKAKRLLRLVKKHSSRFTNKLRTDTYVNTQHWIRLKDGWRPVRRRIPFFAPDKQKIMMDSVKDLLARDLIERKETEWRAPLLVVPKPYGGLRTVIDYKGLNEMTIPDSYPNLGNFA
jgi:hypothetical protein